MCNLYSITSSQAAIRQLARAIRDLTGNLPPLTAVFPDMLAPVIRTAPDGERELTMMRWGFPPPMNSASALVTNVRNTASYWWKPWLQAGHRCLVPVNSFCEWTDSRPKVANWFALDETRPLFFFAGIWRPWTGVRGTKAHPAVGDHLLYSFLTAAANATVAPIHAKAMPVCLLNEADRETWLAGSVDAALALQRPAPDEGLARYSDWTKTRRCIMPTVTHGEFKIKSISDGTLYKARVERNDGAQFHVQGKTTKVWETAQSMDGEGAIGQAIYAIDTGKIK